MSWIYSFGWFAKQADQSAVWLGGSFGRYLAGDAVIVVQSQPWRICGASVWLFGACSQMKTLACQVLENVQ